MMFTPPSGSPPTPAAAETPVESPPGAAPEDSNAATPEDATSPVPPAPTARLPNDDPNRVMGLNEDELRRLLGQPSFMRRDVPALLWRYAASGCTLDVFLYRKGSSGPFTVTHLAARSTTGAPSAVTPASGAEINPRACLGAVLRARSAAPTG